MGTELLERALASTRAVLAEVRTDQLDLPTPCTEWRVRDLINHVVGTQHYAADAVVGRPPSEDEDDVAAGDFLAAYDAAAQASLSAFGADGALDRTLALPFGDLPAGAFLAMMAGDAFTHGWDLAKATGQPTDLDADLAAQLHVPLSTMLRPEMRAEEGRAFRPEQPAPADATRANQLAAFLGRSV